MKHRINVALGCVICITCALLSSCLAGNMTENEIQRENTATEVSTEDLYISGKPPEGSVYPETSSEKAHEADANETDNSEEVTGDAVIQSIY